MQRTLIILKPDCVQRRLVGSILQRFEAKGLRIAALKLLQVDRALGEKHDGEHQGKPCVEGLIAFITGGPVVVGVLEGNEAIAVVR
ncbi:nucleoside-diphosphate kinase, partial [Singulisphaera rosea]